MSNTFIFQEQYVGLKKENIPYISIISIIKNVIVIITNRIIYFFISVVFFLHKRKIPFKNALNAQYMYNMNIEEKIKIITLGLKSLDKKGVE